MDMTRSMAVARRPKIAHALTVDADFRLFFHHRRILRMIQCMRPCHARQSGSLKGMSCKWDAILADKTDR
ncbi:MAG: hypothetical protein IBX58_14645 [Roseovarius sp.]|nr:hypothetical protein [Roseovarius sp.]